MSEPIRTHRSNQPKTIAFASLFEKLRDMLQFNQKATRLSLVGGRVTKWKGRVASIAPAGTSLCIGLMLSSTLSAQSLPTVGSMTDNGTLAGFSDSYALGLSFDGNVILGLAYNGFSSSQGVSWVNGSSVATGLSTLGGTKSVPYGLSADGSVIVGWSYLSGNSGQRPVSWVDGSTSGIDLGTLGGTYGVAFAVSSDGNVIVGQSSTPSNLRYEAVSWVNGSTTATVLGSLGGTQSLPYGLSADGSVIVGFSKTTGDTADHAVSWLNGSTTANDLGTLGGTNSVAYAVSANNAVIVGRAETAGSHYHAAAWFNGSTSATDLGTLGGTTSVARIVSVDGSVIVGSAKTTGDAADHAVSWLNGSPTANDLGTLGGTYSAAYGMNADGSVIVGEAQTAGSDTHAAAWFNGSTSATDLGTLGGTYSYASAVSADGSLIVGASNLAGDAVSRAFILRTGLPMQDYSNLIASFGAVANDTLEMVSSQQTVLGTLLGTGCAPVGEANTCLAVSGNLLHTGASSSIGGRGTGLSQLTAGHKFSSNFIAGTNIALGRVRQAGSSFGDSTQNAVSLWSNYSENGSFRTGLMAHAAIGTAQSTATINRGIGFANVVVSSGKADLSSSSGQASFSYGIEAKSDWLITPMTSITWIETSRSAYTETTGLFPASFDKLTTQSSYATFGINGQRPIDAKSSVSFAVGADIDINVDNVALNGTSSLPAMTAINITDSVNRNKLRPYIGVGYSYNFNQKASLTGNLMAAEPIYGGTPQVNLGVRYAVSF